MCCSERLSDSPVARNHVPDIVPVVPNAPVTGSAASGVRRSGVMGEWNVSQLGGKTLHR